MKDTEKGKRHHYMVVANDELSPAAWIEHYKQVISVLVEIYINQSTEIPRPDIMEQILRNQASLLAITPEECKNEVNESILQIMGQLTLADVCLPKGPRP